MSLEHAEGGCAGCSGHAVLSRPEPHLHPAFWGWGEAGERLHALGSRREDPICVCGGDGQGGQSPLQLCRVSCFTLLWGPLSFIY